MRVTVVRSGGVAGMVTTTTLDAADLDDPRTAELRSLVAACSFRERSGPVAPALRDGFAYEVTVHDDDGSSRGVRFVQGTSPEGMDALLRWVEDCPAGRRETGR
ncbi:protealysin inhibitor emfourin [Actinomycetospora sp. OC33-EN08]|uniref:Protealysin inhibitor emfourin n=1 Tax=Actinomycetospora aurantiaca TaxID=3129233 RepID=A0ABU8MXE4_9PSEU